MAYTGPIISADSHVNPPPFFWNDYLPGHLKDRAPKLVSTEDGDFIEYEGKKAPFTLLGAVAGQKFTDYKAQGDFKELLRISRPGGWDPVERLKDMDQDNISAEVLYGGGPLSSPDTEFCLASFRAYNDWLADFCSHEPDRFIGIGYIPTWDVDIAIREVEHAHSRGLRGVLIAAYPPAPPKEAGDMLRGIGNLGIIWPASGRSYNEPDYDRLWRKICDLGMAVHVHLAPALSPPGTPAPKSFLHNLTVGKMFAADWLADAILSGLFQRFPEMTWVTVESGIGWGAFLVEYMDRNWERHRYHTESVLTEPPSHYFRRNIKGTFLHDPVAIRERHTIGVETIMFSTDYPHSDTTWPNSTQILEEHLAGIPEEDKRKIAFENAANLYRVMVKV